MQSALSDPAASLTPYAVEVRYPDADRVTEEDARQAIRDAEEVHHYVLSHLGERGDSPDPIRSDLLDDRYLGWDGS